MAKASIGRSTYANIKESADESWLTLASSYEIKSFIYSVCLKATAALTKVIYSEIRKQEQNCQYSTAMGSLLGSSKEVWLLRFWTTSGWKWPTDSAFDDSNCASYLKWKMPVLITELICLWYFKPESWMKPRFLSSLNKRGPRPFDCGGGGVCTAKGQTLTLILV